MTAPGNQVGFLGMDGRYFLDGYGTSDAAALVSGAVALVRRGRGRRDGAVSRRGPQAAPAPGLTDRPGEA